MKQNELSTGIIPVRRSSHKIEYLILRCYNYWDFPKGNLEKNEDPLTGAIRELEEETGISQVDFTWGKDFIETAPYGKGKIARYYMAEVKDDFAIKLLPNPVTGIIEHHEYRWLSHQQAKKLLVPRVQIVLDWAHQQINI